MQVVAINIRFIRACPIYICFLQALSYNWPHMICYYSLSWKKEKQIIQNKQTLSESFVMVTSIILDFVHSFLDLHTTMTAINFESW